jgi:membrane protein
MAVSKKIVAFILFSYQHFMKTCCLTRAGSLAFTTIIAIVPLMVVGLSVIAFLPISQLVQTHIQNFIFSNFLVSSANVILDYVDLFVARVHMLSLVSFIFLIVTSASILLSVESSLNAIWRVNVLRSWYRATFFYLLILLLGPLLIALSLLLSFSIFHLMSGKLTNLFIMSVPIFMSYFGFLLTYKIMPNCFVSWRSANIGAVVAAILFELAKIIFSLYIRIFPTYQLVYGAVSAFPILLIWIYICWTIFLFGALMSYAMKNFNYS